MSLQKFNPEMLVLARDLRGMTQTDLSDSLKLSQSLISQIEAKLRDATDEVAQSIADSLQLPREFFYQDEHYSGFGLSMVYFRKRESALKKHLKRLQAEVNVRRIHMKHLLRGVDLQTPYRFEFMDLDEGGSTPEDIAIRLRASWMIPIGPIPNLVAAIENAGGLVFKFPFGTTDIDAMSQWPDDCPPLFFLNSQATADRIRFSLAHELGHVVMHQVAADDIENEANLFASEFLMPRREIASQLMDIDLKRAAALKPYWRVSMAALIRRAHYLKKISDDRYRYLFMEIGRCGYRKREPVQITPEDPQLVPALISSYTNESRFTIDDFSKLLKYPVDEIRTKYFQPTGLRIAR